ncbi:MAG: hypothetical protein CSYNP_04298 [Syntrophus sp. SKADARSKE-3]|nr:hypothetical protein [Syntrophus sp. SKADARSKE-3]
MKFARLGFAIVILFLFCFISQASAYRVEVRNPTDHTVEVGLYVVVNMYGEMEIREATISPHTFHVFKTGMQCPFALEGRIQGHVIRPTCMGPQAEDISSIHSCWPNCQKSSWVIFQRYDGDWHFGELYQ